MSIPKALLSSNSQSWGTPIQLIRQLENETGLKYVMDIAADHGNHKGYMWFERQEDIDIYSIYRLYKDIRTTLPKIQCSIWCNPPYGDKEYPVKWWMINRFLPLGAFYNITFLLPCNKFDQPWVKAMKNQCYIEFVEKRIKYIRNGVPVGGNTQGAVLFHAGPHWISSYGTWGTFEQKWLKNG